MEYNRKNNEIEVFEDRFQATKEEVTAICDNFIKNRHFDGISFKDILYGWDGNRRVYYGRRKDDDSQLSYTHTLGYVEVTELHRLSKIGVRVRIVSVWLPMSEYWKELSANLDKQFPRTVEVARIHGNHGDELIDLTAKKPGRLRDEKYDNAFRRLQDGESYKEVYEDFCKEAGIKNDDKNVRDSFKAAMKRRQKDP